MKCIRSSLLGVGAALAVLGFFPALGIAQNPGTGSVRESLEREYQYANTISARQVGASFFASAAPSGASGGALNQSLFARLKANAMETEILSPFSAVPVQNAAELRDAPTNPLPTSAGSGSPGSTDYAHPKAVYSISDEVARLITGERVNTQKQSIYIQNGTVRILDNGRRTDLAANLSGRERSPSWPRSGNLVVFSDSPEEATPTALADAQSPSATIVPQADRKLIPAGRRDGCRIVYSLGGLGRTALILEDAESTVPAFRLEAAASLAKELTSGQQH